MLYYCKIFIQSGLSKCLFSYSCTTILLNDTTNDKQFPDVRLGSFCKKSFMEALSIKGPPGNKHGHICQIKFVSKLE